MAIMYREELLPAKGSIEGVMKVFPKIKRSDFSESVICDDVRLELK